MFFIILSSAELLGCTTMHHTCCQETDKFHWMMNASLWGDTCLPLCWFIRLSMFFLTEPVSRAVLFSCRSLWEKVKQAYYFYYYVSMSLTAVMQLSQDTQWACQSGITTNRWVTVCRPHQPPFTFTGAKTSVTLFTVRKNIRPGALPFVLFTLKLTWV